MDFYWYWSCRSPGAAAGISAAASSLETFIDGVRDGDEVKEIAVNTIYAGILGAAAGSGNVDFMKGGKLMNDAGNSITHAIKKGVNPAVKKAARKSLKKAGKEIVKSIGSGLIDSIGYGALHEYGSWYTNMVIDRAFGR